MIEHTDSTTIVDSIKCIEPLIQGDSIVCADSLNTFITQADSLSASSLIAEPAIVEASGKFAYEPIIITLLVIVILGLIVVAHYVVKHHKMLKKINKEILKMEETIEAKKDNSEEVVATSEPTSQAIVAKEPEVNVLKEFIGSNDKKTFLKQQIEVISNMEGGFSEMISSLFASMPSNNKDEYFRTINLPKGVDASKVVVVGDIHCDFTSFSMLLSSIVKDDSFDYLSNGYVVCLGDYVDRGSNLMKTICLLLTLKRVMGDRCILLRGNHELLVYEEDKVRSKVSPSETATYLNDNHIEEVDFCKRFVEYFTTLPTYCIVNSAKKRFMLVHGGICKDQFMNEGGRINEKGEVEFMTPIPTEVEDEEPKMVINEEKKKQLLDMMLYSMMWGDPDEYKKKIQTAGSRFDFGSQQFERFMSLSNLDILIRSHEPEKEGIKEFYGGKLYTIFSSGGVGNEDSEYSDAESAGCVIKPKYIILDTESNINIKDIY